MTKLQLVTLCAWILYIPYYFMMERWAQSVIALIRVDLLLVYPLLALLTLAMLVQWLKNNWLQRKQY